MNEGLLTDKVGTTPLISSISSLLGGHRGLRAVPISSHEIFQSLQFVVYLVLYYYGPPS